MDQDAPDQSEPHDEEDTDYASPVVDAIDRVVESIAYEVERLMSVGLSRDTACGLLGETLGLAPDHISAAHFEIWITTAVIDDRFPHLEDDIERHRAMLEQPLDKNGDARYASNGC